MNVVIYARYSSDRQTEQSIEGQLKECYEYAQRNCYSSAPISEQRKWSPTVASYPCIM